MFDADVTPAWLMPFGAWQSAAEPRYYASNTEEGFQEGSDWIVIPRVTEHSMLYATNLPSFGGHLSEEESESMLSALATPFLRLPIFLQFLSAGIPSQRAAELAQTVSTEADGAPKPCLARAAVLGNRKFRALFRAVCYEPGPWSFGFSDGEPTPTTVPCPDDISTNHGYLELEVRQNPGGVAEVVASILDQLTAQFSAETTDLQLVEEEDDSLYTHNHPTHNHPIVLSEEVESSTQAGLLCALTLCARVEYFATHCCTQRNLMAGIDKEVEPHQAEAEAAGVCAAARLRATVLLQSKIDAAVSNAGGTVNLAVLQVVSAMLEVWHWASDDERSGQSW